MPGRWWAAGSEKAGANHGWFDMPCRTSREAVMFLSSLVTFFGTDP